GKEASAAAPAPGDRPRIVAVTRRPGWRGRAGARSPAVALHSGRRRRRSPAASGGRSVRGRETGREIPQPSARTRPAPGAVAGRFPNSGRETPPVRAGTGPGPGQRGTVRVGG